MPLVSESAATPYAPESLNSSQTSFRFRVDNRRFVVAAAAGCGSLPPPVGVYILFVHEHLRRLTRVWIEPPIYFITICTRNRRNILTHENAAKVLIAEWQCAQERHRWKIGRYVIMPDHVHFFCRPEHEAKTLSRFIGAWKTWTSRNIQKTEPQPAAATTAPQALWQREFFDHLLRSNESYSKKWNYVRDNPVRSGFVASADDWPHAGEIERFEF